jgi:predicted phosphohydrolase
VRLVWITDPHLNHVSDQNRERWFAQIASHGRDGIVISGDISEGDDVVFQLTTMADRLACPIYFVLGNHDFYHSSIGRTRQKVIQATRERKQLHYLTDCVAIGLGNDCYLVGEDGWGDASEGSFEDSYVRLNDFRLIEDFVNSASQGWKQQLQDLGKASAARLTAKIAALPEDIRDVLVVTHVPPHRDACWYQGQTTDDHWAPFFVCGQIGQALLSAAQQRVQSRFIVLCGHTHHAGIAHLAANLTVFTGAAEYGKPDTEGQIEIDEQGLRVTLLRS